MQEFNKKNWKKNNNIFPFPLKGLIYIGVIVSFLGISLAVLNLYAHLNHYSLGFDNVYTQIRNLINSTSSSVDSISIDETMQLDDDESVMQFTESQINIQNAAIENSLIYLDRIYELQKKSTSTDMMVKFQQFPSPSLKKMGVIYQKLIAKTVCLLKN